MGLAHRAAFFLLLHPLPACHPSPDVSYPDIIPKTLAFGSCHSRKRFDKAPPGRVNIWDSVIRHEPDAFLWAGDAIYPPARGTASVDALRREYDIMRTNSTIGYARTVLAGPSAPPGGVHGTWDDHDYGGNDRGKEMPGRHRRRDAYLDFLGVPTSDPRRSRDGLYGSVSFGTAPRKALVLFLDTRWGRDRHCIPSVAAAVPFGAIVSCLTRWMSAGLDFPSIFSACRGKRMLDEEQWAWLESEIAESDAQVHVVVSSVQVLTTNPVVEGWGHFQEERDRLLRLINGLPGLVILSGDVHHAEILDASAPLGRGSNGGTGRILEVTSSGLTHSCSEPFYGSLCAPILEAFPTHRFRGADGSGVEPYFFTGRNYGTIEINWHKDEGNVGPESNAPMIGKMAINVHNDEGDVVLTTGPIMIDKRAPAALTEGELAIVAGCVDGHLCILAKIVLFLVVVLFCFWILWRHLLQQPVDVLDSAGRLSKRKKRE